MAVHPHQLALTRITNTIVLLAPELRRDLIGAISDWQEATVDLYDQAGEPMPIGVREQWQRLDALCECLAG